MDRSPRCYNASFAEFSSSVPVNKNFEGFSLYMKMVAILAMWPASYQQIFISIYLNANIQNMVKNGQALSEKSMFKFSYINGLGPRSRNDLDLQYSHTFINSISCLYLSTFMSLAAIVSETATVFTFSHRKA